MLEAHSVEDLLCQHRAVPHISEGSACSARFAGARVNPIFARLGLRSSSSLFYKVRFYCGTCVESQAPPCARLKVLFVIVSLWGLPEAISARFGFELGLIVAGKRESFSK